MTQTTRRRFLAVPAAAAAAVAVPGLAAVEAQAPAVPAKKVHWRDGKRPEKPPLFSGVVTYGNLVFISGIGAHFEGDIKAHTDHVLKEIQKRLEEVGSSMEKVLKGYHRHRTPGESFQSFTARHDLNTLQAIFSNEE